MKSPILSIVMPVFNHPAELRVMIDSILKSDFQEWELLAVDDGSDDETLSVLEQFALSDSRIRFMRRDRLPKGAQTCRNIGLKNASGEYLCFFDSDDYITPVCLGQRVKILSQREDCDFMVFRNGIYDEDGFHSDVLSNVYGFPIYQDDVKAFCQRTLPFVVWNNIYRKESLLVNGICWDENLMSLQDAQFNMDCLTAGMKYAYSDAPADYGYRTGSSNSVSKKIMSDVHLQSNVYAINRFYDVVQLRYGHKYDSALYKGMLFVYTKVARGGIQRSFEDSLHRVVHDHSRLWGCIYVFHTTVRRFLKCFVSDNAARRLSTIFYLTWFQRMEQRIIPSLIRSMLPLLLIVFCITSCSSSIDSRNDMYELAWKDEFRGNKLDTTLWSHIPRLYGVRSFCELTDDPQLYEVKHGRLRLYAKYNDGVIPSDTARFLTSGIWSKGKGLFTYGKIVVKAKVHGAIGSWPAIWTMPDDPSYWSSVSDNQYSEIDIMEYVDNNDFVYQTAHNKYTLADQKNWYKPRQQNLSKIKKNKYNEYSIEILPDVVIFGVNGKETFRYPKCEENASEFLYGILSHLRLNMQTNPPKFWSSGLDAATFPAWMDIDWVRVYNLKQQ